MNFTNKFIFSAFLLFSISSVQGMDQALDLNEPDDNGFCPIHHACLAGNYSQVQDLISAGVDVCVKNTLGDKNKIHSNVHREDKSIIQTPLHCAVCSGDLEVVELLLNSGAVQDINSDHNAYLNTPLHLAAWFGYNKIADLLLKRGALMNCVNSAGSTPLHSACWNNEPECLKILLEYGADYEQRNTTGLGNTPFYLAAKAGSFECLRILIQKLGDKGVLNEYLEMKCSSNPGYTALDVAISQWQAQACWDLMCAGASLDWKRVKEYVKSYKPLYDFLEKIKNRDLRISFIGNKNKCDVCAANFISDDIIVSLATCGHVFHSGCFEDHCLRDWMVKNPNHAFFNRFKTDKERFTALHSHKPTCLKGATTCSKCPKWASNKNFNIQQDMTLAVFKPSHRLW